MRFLKILGWILLLFVLSFLREYTFEGINDRLYRLQTEQTDQPIFTGLGFLSSFEYYPLYYLKFFLIFFFSIIFLWCTLQLMNLWFKKKNYKKLVCFFFVTVFLFCSILFGAGIAIGRGHEAYAVSRHLIEVIQSPLAAFMLIAFGVWENADSGKRRL